MFDDSAKVEARKELDDMFNDVQPAAAAEIPKPAVFQPKTAETKPAADAKPSRAHKPIVPLAAFFGLALALAGGYYGYQYLAGRFLGATAPAQTESAPANEETGPLSGPGEAADGEQAAAPAAQNREFGPPYEADDPDADGDGLTDAEEAALGTNSQAVDTDGDGLFDREETRVYKTDALATDTDGDGFSDGNEVRDGYNPNGSGRLYEIKSQ